MQAGIVAGLLAAAVWALSATLYVRVPISAAAMATWKNCLATVVLLGILLVTSVLTGTRPFAASAEAWQLLFISGILGLSLADIGYFRSIQILGTQRGIMLTLLTPILTALLSVLFLKNTLTLIKFSGILLTLAGVGCVLSQKPDQKRDDRSAAQKKENVSASYGILCSLLSVILTSAGVIYLKKGTANADGMEATFIRLLSASVCGLAISACAGHQTEYRSLIRDSRATICLFAATMLGTVMGVWLMLICVQKCDAGTAATVTSTSPLFAIPISRVVYGRKITAWTVMRAVIALSGVYMLAHQPEVTEPDVQQAVEKQISQFVASPIPFA